LEWSLLLQSHDLLEKVRPEAIDPAGLLPNETKLVLNVLVDFLNFLLQFVLGNWFVGDKNSGLFCVGYSQAPYQALDASQVSGVKVLH
jgi:hypothetical protein